MNAEQKPEALQLAEKLRDAIRLLDCDFADDIDTNDLSLAAMELESLHARVQELEAKETKPAATLNVWQQAIDAELVNAHLGIAHNDATFEGAQKAINELICWHIDVATNPATNGGQRLTDAKPIVWPEPTLFQELRKSMWSGEKPAWTNCNRAEVDDVDRLYTMRNYILELRKLYTEEQVKVMLEAQGIKT